MGRARERQWPLCTERERNIMRVTERDRPRERERDSDRDRGRERERDRERKRGSHWATMGNDMKR